MVNAKNTIRMKLATTLCLVVLVVSVRATGALQASVSGSDPELGTDQGARPQDVAGSDSGSVSPGQSPETSVRAPESIPAPATYKFRDGTYSAKGSYASPGGTESIIVILVISKDTVIDSSIAAKATNNTSMSYQQDFIANYKELVVGKKLDQLNLGKVSGASATPLGFNAAADSIERQAKI